MRERWVNKRLDGAVLQQARCDPGESEQLCWQVVPLLTSVRERERERENVWEYVRTEVGEKEKKCKIIIINSRQAPPGLKITQLVPGLRVPRRTGLEEDDRLLIRESHYRRHTSCSESDAESIRN